MRWLITLVFLSFLSQSLCRPCTTAPTNSYPFCNPSLPLETRVSDLVNRLTLDEKIPLFQNGAGGVPRLDIPGYQWWSEALHGVAGSPGVSFSAPTPYATSFPQVILTAAGFNRPLVNAIGSAISTEARAFSNVGHAGLTFWAPNINIYRDPRWGRGQETPGEDPYLNSEYAAQFVSGMQAGTDNKYLKVSSCCKHYDAYSLENWHGVDRHHFNAVVTPQDLSDTYLPAFQSCVQVGKASSLMCSYNEVNGVPSCANNYLLNEIARGKWGFDGYITSDCGAVADIIYTHHYTSTPDQTVKAVLSAGMDIDCGNYVPQNLKQAVSSGAVSESLVNLALTHLFSVQFRLGIFDPVSIQPYLKINVTEINTPLHQALALEARQGITLLKNEKDILPFARNRVATIALIGPNADATGVMQGNYAGVAPYLISPQAGLSKYAKVNYAFGASIAGTDKSGFPAACNAAKSSDATVLVVGLDQSQEREGMDRTIISFPGVQSDLISTVADCSKGPVVVVVMAGGQVDLTDVKENPKVSSIVWVGYPGQSGGQAIAEVLFGEVNPSGRLPYTIYPADYINQISMFDMNMRPNATTRSPGRTYRFYTGTPVYPFGFGLSYTTFTYQYHSSEALKLPIEKVTSVIDSENYYRGSSTVLATISITVTNTGKLIGDDSVLAFIIPPDSGNNGNPLRYLAGFEKITLRPGQKQDVVFNVTAQDLSHVAEDGSRVVRTGTFKFQVGDAVKDIVLV